MSDELNTGVINRRVLRQDINNYLQEAILNGKLQPGNRVVETRIAKELGVSQAPVREAIRELELMGIIETIPFKGAVVKKLTKQDIKDIYQVRANLEGMAAKEAAKKITEEHIIYLEQLVEEMKDAAKIKDRNRFTELNIKFHRKIVDIADNELLKKLLHLVNLSEWTFITTKISKRSLGDLAERHNPIIECFKKGDYEAAENIMEQHILEVMEEVLQNFDA
ncbi:MAG: transcriptional Regulator, GntR family [Clostridiales bacterium]|jgi:DNA-binding GntR family transcriptional regulator|nr:transcriptional Regulator, GntR family [Clostridiales bacterium]